jgi:hypothetical protein
MDLDGDGDDELVILATKINDGSVTLRAYDATGTLVAAKTLVPDSTTWTGFQMAQINYDGGAHMEVLIGKARVSDGVGLYEVWKQVGSTFTKQATKVSAPPATSNHEYMVLDVNNDGNQEFVVGYTKNADSNRLMRIHEPQGTSVLTTVLASTNTFSDQKMAVGNFDANAGNGQEVAVGLAKVSDGSLRYKVFNEAGTKLLLVGVSAPDSWQYEILAAGDGSGNDSVVFGLTRGSDGKASYKVLDNAGSTIGGSNVLLNTNQAVAWLAANFDGTAANGDEIVVGYTRVSDGRIGFSAWSRTGGTNLGTVNAAIPGTFINPQFIAMRTQNVTRDDVIIGCAHPTDKPRVDSWRINGTRTLSKRIFNADVT